MKVLSSGDLKVLVVNRASHFFYFRNLIKNENILLTTEKTELVESCRALASSRFKTLNQVNEVLLQKEAETCSFLLPLDASNSFDVWYSNELFRSFPGYGISAGIIDCEWVYNLSKEGRREKLGNLVTHLSGIFTPDEDRNLNVTCCPISTSGVFLEKPLLSDRQYGSVLIIPDFADYHTKNAKKWIEEVSAALTAKNIEFEITYFDSNEFSFVECEGFLERLAQSSLVITPRSYVYYLARAWNINSVIYDSGPYVSTSFDRDLNSKSAYIRSKRDFVKVLESFFNASDVHQGLCIAVNSKGKLPAFSTFSQLTQINEHIVVWGRMPPYNYSGGRYHGWLIAEGLASLGYKVTLMTDNCPYFISDFAHLPGHRNIQIKTTENFLDKLSYPSHTASKVIVIPGMDKSGTMYRGAIDYAAACGAKIGLINFESPNWFNSMVFPNRDPSLWNFWDVTSQFSSLILSTTDISREYAKDYYVNVPDSCSFEFLYAPINSKFATKYENLKKKENRVVVFFPRHGYSAHKGWQNIIDIIGDSFRNHTVVFLCGESDLPEDVTQRLCILSEEIGFSIEYKVKIDDEQKFAELSRACLLLFPSQFEGYGYPPLEALSVGTPSVAFDLPVLRETCKDYLLFAPIGDWESFKHLANKALATKYRLNKSAVEHALSIAGFEVFTTNLKEIISQWDVSGQPIHLESTKKKIEKAFFELPPLVRKFRQSKSASIESKAIIKEVLYEIDFEIGNEQRVNSSERVLLIVENIQTIKIKLGSNHVIDLIKHLNFKGIAVDLVSTDFALETLLSDFTFSINRFISVGRSEKSNDEMRGEVGLLILKMLHQYNYLELISVDGFLAAELNAMERVLQCPKVSLLELNHSASNAGIHEPAHIYQSANISLKPGNKVVSVPDSILLERDRKEWLVNGPNNVLAIVTDQSQDHLLGYFSKLEYVHNQAMSRGIPLVIKLYSTENLCCIPYFMDSIPLETNQELYKALKQSMFVLNLTSEQLLEYTSTLSKLVGTLELSATASNIKLVEEIAKITSDLDSWKKERRFRFNEVLNTVASSDYYSGVLALSGQPTPNLLAQFESYKSVFLQDFEESHPSLFKQFKDKLERGLLVHAIEVLKRYSSVADDKLAVLGFIVRMSILAGKESSAIEAYNLMRRRYPLESLVYILGSDIKEALSEYSSASQHDYFALMLDSINVDSILGASRASNKARRQLDLSVHAMIVSQVITNQELLVSNNKVSATKHHLLLALIQEFSNFAAH